MTSFGNIVHGTTRRVVRLKHEVLQRTIGVGGLYSVGYGDVGSSVFYALGVTTLWAMGAAPLAIAVGGVFFVATVLTYAELATAIPEAGGISVYARRAFNDITGFIAGWALLLDYVVTIAISAYIVGPYLGYFIPALRDPDIQVLFTMGVIMGLTALNILGVKQSAGFSLILAMVALATQAVLLVVGAITFFSLPKLLGQIQFGTMPTWSNFIYGITISMVAYTGVSAISQMAGEARDPAKTVPRALLLTMAAVLVMSLGLSTVALSAMTPAELSTTWVENPIAGIAHHMPVIGPYLSPWIALVGGLILLVATNAGILGASRLAYSMGDSYLLPTILNRVHPRFKTPYITLLIFPMLAALLVLLLRSLSRLADLYNFGAMLAYSLAHLSLIGLRWAEPDLPRPFKLRGQIRIKGREIPVIAVLGFLGTSAVWVVVVLTHPYGRRLGFLWMAVGMILYLVYRVRAHMPVVEPVSIETVEVPGYHRLDLKSILVPFVKTSAPDTVQVACKLASKDRARVTALYAIEVPLSLPLEAPLVTETEEAQRILTQSQAIAEEYGIPLEVKVVRTRSAGKLIVETASEVGCQCIVLQDTERPQIGSLLFGKTVDYVIRNAPCPVLVSNRPLQQVRAE